MAEETGKKWKASLASFFVQEVADEEPTPPKPAAIPSVGARPSLLSRPIVATPVATPVVDQASLVRIEEALLEAAPEGYKELVSGLATLGDTLSDEALLYKAVLKIAAKKGFTAATLGLNFDQCMKILEEQAKTFTAELNDQITKKVGGRQQEVARLDADLARLQEEMSKLAAQRDTEARAIETDTAKIETVRANFEGAYQVVFSTVTDQKNKLTTYGRG